MDDKAEETNSKNLEQEKTEEFGDPELNNDPITSEPETPIIPAPEPDEPEPAASYGSIHSPRKRNPKNLLYLVGLIVIVVVLFNAVKMLRGGSKTLATPSPTPVAVETATPSPEASVAETATPTPTKNPVDSATGLDRSNLSVAIQNGSGTAGVAGKASDLLKGLGYNVTSTGNADSFGFTDTTVKIKATQKKYLPLLIKDLSGTYTIGSSSSDLDASSSADVLIIVGK